MSLPDDTLNRIRPTNSLSPVIMVHSIPDSKNVACMEDHIIQFMCTQTEKPLKSKREDGLSKLPSKNTPLEGTTSVVLEGVNPIAFKA